MLWGGSQFDVCCERKSAIGGKGLRWMMQTNLFGKNGEAWLTQKKNRESKKYWSSTSLGGKVSWPRRRRSRYFAQHYWTKTLERGSTVNWGCLWEWAAFEKSGCEKARVEGTLAGGHFRTADGGQAAEKQSVAGFLWSASTPWETRRSYKASTGDGADVFHPKEPLGLGSETCEEIEEFSANVTQCGCWAVQGSTLFFFLVPKNVTSQRPRSIALLRVLIRWWEWLRAPVIQERKTRSRARWDATKASNGGAERTASEAVWEMDEYKCNVEGMGYGAFLWWWIWPKLFEKVQLQEVWSWAMDYGFSQRILRSFCGCFLHQRRVLFEGYVVEPLQTMTAIVHA